MVEGARYSVSSTTNSGSGRAFRSSLPTALSGMASRTTNAAGTIYAGRVSAATARTCAISSSTPGVRTRKAASAVAPAGPATPSVTAKSTPSARPSTASISPSSMRWPRTLTWKSVRPMYSSSRACPVARVQRTRSPVRYMSSPGPPKGLAMNRDAVRLGLA